MAFTRQEYISKYGNLAVAACLGERLFPSVHIAQGILESNNGNSQLTVKYKNHFGIKSSSTWRGKTANMQTGEVYAGNKVTENATWRVYDSSLASYFDRVRFLKENPRYAKAGVFDAKTPQEQVQALKNAGYATDPDYVQKVMAVIKANDLERFDKKKEEYIQLFS